jgi:hypothetical protein
MVASEYVRWIRSNDVGSVGGKNASLGGSGDGNRSRRSNLPCSDRGPRTGCTAVVGAEGATGKDVQEVRIATLDYVTVHRVDCRATTELLSAR